MKERPILFSSEMVRAILEGRKTMTRRVIGPQPGIGCKVSVYISDLLKWWIGSDFGWSSCYEYRCPYGQPGDRLWVRETWGGVFDNLGIFLQWGNSRKQFRTYEKCVGIMYKERDGDNSDYSGCWVPSIFMPRWASRIALEVTGVRVERVQDISPEDAYCEGVRPIITAAEPDILAPFRDLWNAINAKRGYGWDVNPWVWVVSFRVVGQPATEGAQIAPGACTTNVH